MDIIHLLPDSVANQIAAGEVIQRPSSVIKELVENSIDAGATTIDIYVKDAGRTCIQVIDDGKGMSETDARLAFERHATSKITRAEDLFTLRTMGFRGEALPSIVAVSQVTLQTRTPDSELGTKLDIEGGRILNQEPCVCAIGANFEVKNLFFNIPARRKFLKSNNTELNNIIQEFERIALVNHSVAFSLTCDGNTTIRLMATNLHRRIVDIFGKKIGGDLITVEVDTTLVKIRGFVGRPESSRKKGAHQFFYVNGRYMRHPYFSKAVAESFIGLVPEGEQVPFFLYLDIAPENIDVNISPTKTEVKFENEPAIWQILYAGIKEALGKFNAVPIIDFDNACETDIPVMQKTTIAPKPPRLNVDTSYNPFVSGDTPASPQIFNKDRRSHTSAKDWTKLYDQLLPEAEYNEKSTENLFSEENIEEAETSSSHFQYRGQYIVTATNSGLIIVDQHRAHVRILYDKYIKQLETRAITTQGLLFPELINLPHSDSFILEQIIEEVRSIGFDIENLGNGSFSINGLPTGTEGLNPQRLIQDIVATVKQGGKADLKSHRHSIALSLAKTVAIVVGQVLTDEEMSTLLSNLFKSSNPNISPNGKTIITILKQNCIEKMFN